MQELSYDGAPPDPHELSRRWHRILGVAKEIVDVLPPDEVGKCVVNRKGELYTAGPPELELAVERREVLFHAGRIRGAFPQVVGER